MTVLDRTTFSTSRLLEFFTEKELEMQMGVGSGWWAIAIVKELIDNALDACETSGTPPEIRIEVGPDWFTVQDNGPGLPYETFARSLDYMLRVSDKTHYVSPTRGQLGNALKCVWAAPFVMDGERGRVDVTTGGLTHRVDVTLDRIAQEPKLEVTTHPDGLVKNGTFVKVYGGFLAGCLEEPPNVNSYNSPPDVFRLVADYAMFNPHATFSLQGCSQGRSPSLDIKATDTAWKKWRPDQPTSPHWYNAETLASLVAAYIVADRERDRDRTVREFVSEFRGLAGTAKQKLVTEGQPKYLREMTSNGDVDVGDLLTAMKEHSKPVKAGRLGTIGEDHLCGQLAARYSIEPESVRYRKITNGDGELPHVLEMAFGIFSDDDMHRVVVTGLNWAPTLTVPVHELTAMLGKMRIDRHDPVCVVMHIARPRFDFTSKGKGQISV